MALHAEGSRPPSSPASYSTDSRLPLQITLAYLVCQNFPRGPGTAFTVGLYGHQVTSQVLAVVAREILEVSPEPATFATLLRETDAILQTAVQVGTSQAATATLLGSLAGHFATVDAGCAFLDTLEKDVRDRVSVEDEYDATQYTEPIDRRSPVGQFLRELLLVLRGLSFDQSAVVARHVAEWLGICLPGPSKVEGIPASDRRVGMDDALERRGAAVQARRRAEASGDYSRAINAIRRFYDFPVPGADRHQHQHGLLNLASFYLDHEEIQSARSALDEAIRVARYQGDAVCLRLCMSLARRLDQLERPPALPGLEHIRVHQAPLPVEVLPRLDTPMDDLWSISAALDLGEPVHVAVRRLYLALSKHEYSAYKPEEDQKAEKDKKVPPSGWLVQQEMDVASWHAIQAGLWALLGSDTLARIHEDMALDDPDIDAGTLNFTLFARSQRLARHGKFEEAIASLIAPDAIDNLDHAGYLQWTSVLGDTLRTRAASLRDSVSLRILAASLPESSAGQTLDTAVLPVPARLSDAIHRAHKLREARSPTSVVLPQISSVVQLSRELGLWAVHRTASVGLAEVLLSMGDAGSAQRALNIVEPLWTQIQNSADMENISRGSLVLAKGRLSLALDQEMLSDETDAVMSLLRLSWECSRSVGLAAFEEDAVQLMSLLRGLQSLPPSEEARLGNAERLTRFQQQVRDVCEIIRLVGVRITAGKPS